MGSELEETDAFLLWVATQESDVIREAELETQLSAYVRTFPGRNLDLLTEAMEVAIQQRKESDE